MAVKQVEVSPETTPGGGRSFLLDDAMFEVDKDGMPVPHFSVQETAKAFFGRSSDWLRWRYRADKPRKGSTSVFPQGYFVLDGEPIDAKFSDKGARYYTLADIERMAYALAQNGVLDHEALDNVLSIVKANAMLHNVFPEESE